MTIQRKPPKIPVRISSSARKPAPKTNTKSSKSSSKAGGAGGTGGASKGDAVKNSSGDFAVDQIDGAGDREAKQQSFESSSKGDLDGLGETVTLAVKNGKFRRPPKGVVVTGDGPDVAVVAKNAKPVKAGAAQKAGRPRKTKSKKAGSKGGSKRVEKNDDADEMQEAEGVSAMVETSAGAFSDEPKEFEANHLLDRVSSEDGPDLRRSEQRDSSTLGSDAPKGVVVSQAMQVAPPGLKDALTDVSLSQLENDVTLSLANVPRDTSGAPIVQEDPFSSLERSLVNEGYGLDSLSADSDERGRGRSEGLAFFKGRDDPMLKQRMGLQQIVPTLMNANAILGSVGQSLGDSVAGLGVGAGDNDEGEGGEEEIVEEEEE